jgi:DNA-directed DNA polymerase III PolC
MSFLLGISEFSKGEGVYRVRDLMAIARRLGYQDLVMWDRGLHGYAKLRGDLEWAQELEALGEKHPAFEGPGVQASGFRIHLACRFSWRGHDYGALPCSDDGYAQLNRLLTKQAHQQGEGELPFACLLLAETLQGLDLLLREGCFASLLAHPKRAQETRRALSLGLAVVAPQVLRFRTEAGLELHRLKRAIASQSTLVRTEAQWDLKDAAMSDASWRARFPFADATIARDTHAMLERIAHWKVHWGDWVNADPLGLEGGALDAVLRERVQAGIRARYEKVNGDLESRMEKELGLIREKGFANYFLLVQDMVNALKPQGLPSRICGRGSGAASLVSYALDLSNVDPVGTNLMFERFLTKERKDPPDMDIDFAWDEREEVILNVFRRYAPERVAMVSNHVFFKPRSALRAVAMAHGRPESELKALAQKIRGWEGGLDGLGPDHPWTRISAQAKALEGHFHQMSVHPGGTVVTPGPLWEHVASEPAPAKVGVSITCWDKEGVENYGLVKIDLLGNRSLAVIRDAYRVLGDQVPKNIGEHARQDTATQATLAQGDSIGVFYVESPAMRQLQQRVKKGDFETLVIHSSLIRPAAYRWVDRYVKRARGDEAFIPSDPVFERLLSDSYGVLVYQEDVIKVCVELAGWSHHQADQLRKLLGKPDCMERLPSFEQRFRQGCTERGVRMDVMEEAWDMIRTFQGYSFCKPHSASYAQVSFESAWLKTHHPAVFFASVISNQGGFYPAIAYVGDARRHHLVLRGPDVNRSIWAFRAESEQALRVGLMQVKGARQDELERLLNDREHHGPFQDLANLLQRVNLSLPTLEALCAAGAFDHWAPDGDRTRLMWEPLGGVPMGLRPRPTDPFDRADLELETLSLSLEVHPAALARVRQGGGPHRAIMIEKTGQALRFWALVVAEKTVRTERGDAMQFITFEDETGLCEAVAFPPAFARRRRPFRVGEVLPVRGRAVRQDGLAMLDVQA